jgi:ankyrin repeat protein
MSDKHFDYKFKGVPPTPQIGIPSPIAEVKAEKPPRLSFAQQVGTLSRHDRKAISKYSAKPLEGLSMGKQRAMLGRAIEKNDIKAVKVLIECGVDINHYDERGVTLLFRSCELAHVEIVELLLINGADPNILAK